MFWKIVVFFFSSEHQGSEQNEWYKTLELKLLFMWQLQKDSAKNTVTVPLA